MGVTGISGFPSPLLCYTPRWRGGGGTLDFKWWGWSKDFFGFQVFDSEIVLGEGKFVKYFFGWLDWSSYFLWYSKQSEDLWWHPRIPRGIVLQIKYHQTCFVAFFKAWKFGMGYFCGLIFGPEIVLGLLEVVGVFLGLRFLPPFDHPWHLKSGVPSWGDTSV